MSYFVEVDGDMGAYDMTELEAWKRYSDEIIDAKENGETYCITIGESLEDGAFEQYEYDESTFDSYCDWVLDQIITAAGRVCCDNDDECPRHSQVVEKQLFSDIKNLHDIYPGGIVNWLKGLPKRKEHHNEDDCPHCGFDRGDHDVSDRNRLIPCESDGERD